MVLFGGALEGNCCIGPFCFACLGTGQPAHCWACTLLGGSPPERCSLVIGSFCAPVSLVCVSLRAHRSSFRQSRVPSLQPDGHTSPFTYLVGWRLSHLAAAWIHEPVVADLGRSIGHVSVSLAHADRNASANLDPNTVEVFGCDTCLHRSNGNGWRRGPGSLYAPGSSAGRHHLCLNIVAASSLFRWSSWTGLHRLYCRLVRESPVWLFFRR
jgi:hypothetical protein